MKIKIRGLVFVGFAAAVFASSARADDPAPTPHIPAGQAAKTTVTSKNYVDAKFQAKEKRVELTGNQTYSGLESNIKTSNEHYPSMKVLSDAVGDGNFQPKLTTGGKPSLGTYDANGVQLWKAAASGEYVAVSEPVGGTTISFDIDSGTIADTATKIGDAGASGAGLGVKKRLTTAKAVYDYINGDGSGNGGFQPKATAMPANGNTPGMAQLGVKVPRLDSNNQPVLDEQNQPIYDATWYNLVAGQDGGIVEQDSADNPFVRVYRDDQSGAFHNAGVYVDLSHPRIAVHTSYTPNVNDPDGSYSNAPISGTVSEGGNLYTGDALRLVTSGAVYEYAVPMDWTERAGAEKANKTLVTNANGVVGLSNVPAMPDFTQNDVCKNENVNCALVTTWVPADPSNNVEAHMELHWTVMADSTDTVTNP